MNTAEYERMYHLEDSYWWYVGRHCLVESILRSRFGAPSPLADPERTILDVGCGTGAMSVRLTKWGRLVSADYSPLALQFSQRRGIPNLIRADAMKLPLAGAQFDVLIAMDMLEHLPDDKAALAEFYRVLKPGGLLIATVPAYPHLWSEHDVAAMHFRRYLRPELLERVRSAGFRVEKLSHTMTTLYPIVALQRRLSARRPHDSQNPRTSIPIFPAPINFGLKKLLSVENSVAQRVNLPFGVTLLTVAKKPS